MADEIPHRTVVVIGSGFGGTMTALPLARKFHQRDKGETVLILERGAWWTTPVPTVQDREVETYGFLTNRGQPVQYWALAESFRGFIDLYTRCFRRKRNEDGLDDSTNRRRSRRERPTLANAARARCGASRAMARGRRPHARPSRR